MLEVQPRYEPPAEEQPVGGSARQEDEYRSHPIEGAYLGRDLVREWIVVFFWGSCAPPPLCKLIVGSASADPIGADPVDDSGTDAPCICI